MRFDEHNLFHPGASISTTMATTTSALVDNLAGEFQNLDTVYFTDKDAYIKIGLGSDEAYSRFGKWSEVVKVVDALFKREVFDKQRPQWLEAGCLFISLCIYRATLERKLGEPFRNVWMGGEILSPVRAVDYLGFARRCFNSGLPYPVCVRIPLEKWMNCQSDLGVCVSQAERLKTSALELYRTT
ncbi:hypothetical protein BGZ63DRAFT_496627 [Mariannaea sp. PMI_226]|nr:hypothetical protein BGZ63DRAFT_496627 [Mariannaea sp. PMI_226]